MGLNISSKDAKTEEEGGGRGKIDAARAVRLKALATELTCLVW